MLAGRVVAVLVIDIRVGVIVGADQLHGLRLDVLDTAGQRRGCHTAQFLADGDTVPIPIAIAVAVAVCVAIARVAGVAVASGSVTCKRTDEIIKINQAPPTRFGLVWTLTFLFLERRRVVVVVVLDRAEVGRRQLWRGAARMQLQVRAVVVAAGGQAVIVGAAQTLERMRRLLDGGGGGGGAAVMHHGHALQQVVIDMRQLRRRRRRRRTGSLAAAEQRSRPIVVKRSMMCMWMCVQWRAYAGIGQVLYLCQVL